VETWFRITALHVWLVLVRLAHAIPVDEDYEQVKVSAEPEQPLQNFQLVFFFKFFAGIKTD